MLMYITQHSRMSWEDAIATRPRTWIDCRCRQTQVANFNNMLVHQSTTRRKACVACVQAKRRCDLGFPLCSRCASRGLNCQYANATKAVDRERRPLTPRLSYRTSGVVCERPSQMAIASPPSVSTDCEPGSTSIADLFPTNAFDCEDRSMGNMDELPLSSFQFPELSTISEEQVEFVIRQFKSCIPQLVQQNRSPFIHPSSYHLSPSNVYQDLLGVSAMYNQKTPQNQAVIFSMLNHKVSSLIASSNSSSWLLEDYLLGVQALIFYQIIRLFDGDIRQRANAEKHFSELETWTKHLRLTSDVYANEFGPDKSLYQRWVFIESTRRTILMSIMLQAMYSLLKEGVCDKVPLMATLPVSVNGTLWNMSEEDWWNSSLGLGSDLSTYQEFTTEWGNGKQFHRDMFETILLAACRHNFKRRPLNLV